jgi:hypothetical protein
VCGGLDYDAEAECQYHWICSAVPSASSPRTAVPSCDQPGWPLPSGLLVLPPLLPLQARLPPVPLRPLMVSARSTDKIWCEIPPAPLALLVSCFAMKTSTCDSGLLHAFLEP